MRNIYPSCIMFGETDVHNYIKTDVMIHVLRERRIPFKSCVGSRGGKKYSYLLALEKHWKVIEYIMRIHGPTFCFRINYDKTIEIKNTDIPQKAKLYGNLTKYEGEGDYICDSRTGQTYGIKTV